MIIVALRGLLGRKTRAVLTAISIMLGTAMITGTFVLRDQITGAFTQHLRHRLSRAPTWWRRRRPRSARQRAQAGPLPASVIDTIKGVDGVAEGRGPDPGAGRAGRQRQVRGLRRGARPAWCCRSLSDTFNPYTFLSGTPPRPTRPGGRQLEAGRRQASEDRPAPAAGDRRRTEAGDAGGRVQVRHVVHPSAAPPSSATPSPMPRSGSTASARRRPSRSRPTPASARRS